MLKKRSLTPIEDLHLQVALHLGYKFYRCEVIDRDSSHQGQVVTCFMSPEEFAGETEKGYFDMTPCEPPETFDELDVKAIPAFSSDPAMAHKIRENLDTCAHSYYESTYPAHRFASIAWGQAKNNRCLANGHLDDPRYLALCRAFVKFKDRGVK